MHFLISLGLIISVFYPLASNAELASTEPITPIPTPIINNPEEIELGRILFSDVRLSKGNQLSCASCHSLSRYGGADGQQFSSGVNGQKGTLNSPTVFNASLHFRQFWNGRAANLAEQIEGPIHNPVEMASNWAEIVAKLSKDDFYLNLFNRVYPQGLTAKTIKQAIIQFEKSLLTPNSRFDQYLQGKKNALTADEEKGYQLFKQYGCISCHHGAAMGGTMYQKLGVLTDYLKLNTQTRKTDLGRYTITHKEQDRLVFKVPSLRNIELTAPYFHDGSVASLSEAVKIMLHYQLGRLDTPANIKKIVLFLKTLNGEYQGQPLKLKRAKKTGHENITP